MWMYATSMATGGKFPEHCARCARRDGVLVRADGWYEKTNGVKVGICRKHKSHAGCKIVWCENNNQGEV